MNISLIVEGHGDTFAVPALIRKVAVDLEYFGPLQIPKPFRLSRGQMVKRDELMRAVDFMSRKAGDGGVVFVLFDADDDCPVDLASTVQGWLDERPDLRAVCVVANKEFEAWYLACASCLGGVRGFAHGVQAPVDPDAVRDGKGWMGRWMPDGYSETLDQPAFAASLDFRLAMKSRSFRKFLKELGATLGVEIPPPN